MSGWAPVRGAALAWAVTGLVAVALSACSAEGGDGSAATVDVVAVGETAEGDATQDASDASADLESDEADSDDDSNDDSGAMPDPCALLSPAEIESAAGFAVGDGVADADRQSDTKVLCEWTSTGVDGFVAIAVAPGYPVPFGEGETVVGTTVAIDIPGASEAFRLVTYGSVAMRVDGDYIVVSSAGSPSSESSDVTLPLASLVASRYGG